MLVENCQSLSFDDLENMSLSSDYILCPPSKKLATSSPDSVPSFVVLHSDDDDSVGKLSSESSSEVYTIKTTFDPVQGILGDAISIPRSINYGKSLKQSFHHRKTILMNAVYHLRTAFNSGDHGRLFKLIDDLFVDNCYIQSSAMNREECGKSYIFEIFNGLWRNIPDMVIESEPSRFKKNINVITTYVSGTGTKITKKFPDNAERLINIIHYNNDTGANADYHMKNKATEIMLQGDHLKFRTQSIWKFDLTPDRSRICRCTMYQKVVELKRCTNSDLYS